MKKIFLHNYLFRLLVALASGILSYLLILMTNNNLSQLTEYVFSSELYLCCGIALVLFEILRLVLARLEKGIEINFTQHQAFISCFKSIAISVLITTIVIYIYYIKVVGFSPSKGELIQFNIIFSFIAVLYTLVYLSNLYLFARSSNKLKEELILQKQIEEDFEDFRRGINSDLLFESLELVLAKVDNQGDEAESLVDRLAVIYRYLLSVKERQVVPFAEEYEMLVELTELLNKLPYRKLKVNLKSNITAMVIPGSLLHLVQEIVRTSIVSETGTLDIYIDEDEDFIKLSYNTIDKLNIDSFQTAIKAIKRSYKILCDQKIDTTLNAGVRSILIPILKTKAPAL